MTIDRHSKSYILSSVKSINHERNKAYSHRGDRGRIGISGRQEERSQSTQLAVLLVAIGRNESGINRINPALPGRIHTKKELAW
jgi:hypothetical protein